MGMTIVNPLPRWIGILEPSKVFARLNIREQKTHHMAFESYERLVSLRADSSVSTVQSFDSEREYLTYNDDVEAFVRRRGSDLNHRYVEIPKHNYRLIEGLSGIGVWRAERISDTDESVVRILEWTFPSGSVESESAMAVIVSNAISERAILIDFFCAAKGVGARLLSFGFCSAESFSPSFVPWLFRPLCYDRSCLVVNAAIKLPKHISLEATKIYLTRGDSDADRIKL